MMGGRFVRVDYCEFHKDEWHVVFSYPINGWKMPLSIFWYNAHPYPGNVKIEALSEEINYEQYKEEPDA